jgi:hypothetical protein
MDLNTIGADIDICSPVQITSYVMMSLPHRLLRVILHCLVHLQKWLIDFVIYLPLFPTRQLCLLQVVYIRSICIAFTVTCSNPCIVCMGRSSHMCPTVSLVSLFVKCVSPRVCALPFHIGVVKREVNNINSGQYISSNARVTDGAAALLTGHIK